MPNKLAALSATTEQPEYKRRRVHFLFPRFYYNSKIDVRSVVRSFQMHRLDRIIIFMDRLARIVPANRIADSPWNFVYMSVYYAASLRPSETPARTK